MERLNLFELLRDAIRGGMNALRLVTRLVPVGGAGDKVFPPTYASEAKYAFEERLINGESVRTVQLNSVQAESNRLEAMLLAAFERGECPLPVLSVNLPGHGRVTALEAPHRVYDAIFRDSMYENDEFRKSALGKRAVEATLTNATGVYEICPTALLLGAWDSHGAAGGQGTKFPRALTSEIVGFHAHRGVRTGGRIDPLGITVRAAEILENEDGSWEIITDETERTKGKKVRPSEIGHGNIAPTIMEIGGVTISEAQQTAVLSFPQLRRLSFPDPITNERSPERDLAARTVLAALAVYALALQQAEGCWLRSRCHLIPAEAPRVELIGVIATDTQPFALDLEAAHEAYLQACRAARAVGLTWHEGYIDLTPSAKLVELVARSRAMIGARDE